MMASESQSEQNATGQGLGLDFPYRIAGRVDGMKMGKIWREGGQNILRFSDGCAILSAALASQRSGTF